ncbi:MAG: amidohydrolase family protein [Myxococcota bacterium]
MQLSEPIVSADSHIAETEDVFADIDPRYRDQRPRAIYDEQVGALLAIPNIDLKVPMGLLCTGGRPPQEFRKPVRWEEIHPAGYDPVARLAIQDQEGLAAEILYPSVGMVLCNHPDPGYKKACFVAYNRWLAEFCATSRERLIGLGVASLRSIEEGLRELEEIEKLGFRGVMLPGTPDVEDYDHPCYDPIWQACVDLGLPVSFHILTSKGDLAGPIRGPMIIHQIVTVRGNQNIMLMLIFGGVFERFPDLRVVCVEADAGWVPHFCFRMDHAWERHRWHLPAAKLQRLPSEYFHDQIYLTFQDDYSVRHVTDAINMERVMWASDFPHSDGTYPHTHEIIETVTQGMSPDQRAGILRENVAALYDLKL